MDPKLREAVSDLFGLSLDMLDVIAAMVQAQPESIAREATLCQIGEYRTQLIKADERFRSLAAG